jgi:hypothetical protein
MPAGEEVTVPPPLPFFPTERVRVTAAGSLKEAMTFKAALMVTTQLPVPEHPPPTQPANVELPEGIAVKVKTVPNETVDWQALPQSMAAGVDTTRPAPDPAFVNERSAVVGTCSPPAADESLFDFLHPIKMINASEARRYFPIHMISP